MSHIQDSCFFYHDYVYWDTRDCYREISGCIEHDRSRVKSATMSFERIAGARRLWDARESVSGYFVATLTEGFDVTLTFHRHLSLKPGSYSSGSAEREIQASGPRSHGGKTAYRAWEGSNPLRTSDRREGSLWHTLHESLGKDNATASEDAPDVTLISNGKVKGDEINAPSMSLHIN